jgi:hypothetical protein
MVVLLHVVMPSLEIHVLGVSFTACDVCRQ